MKNVGDFLIDLSAMDVKLWVENGHLRCNAPKGVITPDLRAQIQAHKTEIIKQLRQYQTPAVQPTIQPRPHTGPLPLSFAQQRLWFLDQLEDDFTPYNEVGAVSLHGILDIDIFKQAMLELLRRHETLRTTFIAAEGQPVQVIGEPNLSLTVVDLPSLSTEAQETRLQELAQQEAQTPFDLSRGPLLRLTLFRRNADHHVLLSVMHHICGDLWSSRIWVQEFAKVYSALLSNQPSPLPSLPIQYADFARWQREWLQGDVLDRQLDYWRQQLAGAPAVLALPTDRPRPAYQTFEGRRLTFDIDLGLTRQLRSLSGQCQATLFMTCLAAFNVLLARYSGQPDIVVGTPIANRRYQELEPLIGFFANTLVLRTDLAGNPTFIELLERVKTVTQAAYDHQDLPFEKLIEALNPERTLSHAPLFQVMFALQNIPAQAIELPQLTITNYSIETGSVKLDLSVQLYETSSGLQGIIEYSTDLFDAPTIQRMIGHYQTLLKSIVVKPQTPVAELPLLTAAERQQLLVDWNETQVDYPQDECIHQLFEEQVECTPEAVALVFEDRQLTYEELNRQAAQLAYHLRSSGVGPDVLVGICAERSIEMVVGILAILKAGGAYLPLDPTYPAERLAFMIDDAKPLVLLSQDSVLAKVPVLTELTNSASGPKLFRLDKLPPGPKDHRFEPAAAGQTAAGHLAYVIYTSGSTGRPKGVMVEHRSLSNLVMAQRQALELRPDSRVLQFSALSFDASVWEIFATLLSGATLILAAQEDLLPDQGLLALLRRQAITTVTLPPSALPVLPIEPLPALQTLVSAGEACTAALLNDWAPGRRFINAYGPTESTVCATLAVCQAGDDRPPSIGRPIANVQMYIVDAQLQPAPMGVSGELCIGGASLARGYLNRPELTSEKFITNPFGEGRLYRTGDLARYRTDGNIEFLGRLDHQVKVRGFRIELGEIETLLSHHPLVESCVVVAREETSGDKRLVAYLLAQPTADKRAAVEAESESLTTELRQFLKQQLPVYMVPAAFVVLDTFPLTLNGKIDRRALPTPEWRATADYVAPNTSTQDILAGIWTEVLAVERVGIHDNFFERGGDSIISLQIVARAQQAGLRITPKQLFQHQTIAELAAVAGSTAGVQAEQGAVVGPFPLTPIQHWFFEPEQPEPHHFNQAVLLELDPQVDPDRLKQAVRALWRHHDMLRLRCRRDEEGWVPDILAADDPVPFQVIDLAPFSAATRTVALEAEAANLQASFDLSTGPLLRVVLFQWGPDQPARLLIIIHHLAVDGVSWRILLGDLQTGYQQLEQGQPVQLPPKTTAFKTWATWLNETGPDVMAADLDYWLTLKVTDPMLPVDDPEGVAHNTVAAAAQLTASLSVEETEQLLHDVPPVYRTHIDEVLITALAQSLTRWSGRSQVLVDLEGHGREAPPAFEATLDLSRTVGWFTTIYPVLLTVADNEPGDALKAIKEQLRRIPNGGLSYGLLRYLGQEAALNQQPQAQISFNYLGQFDQIVSDSDLILGYAPENSGPAHSPLTERRYLLEVNGLIVDGRLQMQWTYDPAIHTAATIEQLAIGFNEALQDLIAHCLLPDAGGLTPSDFSLVSLPEPAFSRFLDQVALPANNVADIYPLSPLQHGLFFETLNAPASGVYVEQLCLTLADDLDLIAFQQAWQQVLNHHPALRTSFHWEALPEPLQVVWHQVDLPWQVEPWPAGPEAAARLEAFLQADRQRGFDLDQAPLMRLTFFQREGGGYYFVWSSHHLLLDGWSMANLMQDLMACYRAASQDEPVQLAPVRPYRDYVAWLQGQDEAAAEQYWRRTLAGFTAPTTLSVVRPVASTQPSLVQEHRLNLSAAQTDRLQALAQQHRLTLSTLLQGAWALLLSRYSGANDVLFGHTVSGRPPTLSGIETMVGLFINTLPVRVTVDSQAKLLTWLQDLQAGQIEQQRYTHSSLVAIQGWSEVPRPQPLFDTILIYENYPVAASLQSTPNSWIDLSVVEQTQYPVTIVTGLFGGQLTLNLMYDTHRLAGAMAQQMVTHLETILLAMADYLQAPLADLPLLTEAEQYQLLVEWNETHTKYPQDQCIHQLFEAQVERTPDAVALVFEEEALTYRELNNQANQLAHHLRSLGVGPDVLVGICVERSLEMIVGLLAILKADGAYVPLDPTYPIERLRFMVEDTQTSLLLTQSWLAADLPSASEPIQRIDLDTIGSQLADQPQTNPVQQAEAHHLAYVIYTSGSTGRPKGVLVTHANVVRLFTATNDWFHFDTDDVWTLFHSYAFDFSVWEIWGALAYGGRLVIVPYWVSRSPEAFYKLLIAHQVTILNQTPSAFRQLMQAEETGESYPELALRHVIFGGEALEVSSLKPWFERHGDQKPQLVNMYGITETTVHVTYQPLSMSELSAGSLIGRPIPDLQVYILDRHQQLVPIGVPGEMYIGGDGVARGYLNRPELTADRFRANPFGAGKLYRSGDLAQYRTDGRIEFLGRLDYQVKLRGFRIELGEIETLLSRQPLVESCVVLAREDAPGDKRLVAYIVAGPATADEAFSVKADGQSLATELRQYLEQHLPDYMVPSAFVLLNALPLTPNGKIDRKALPAPEWQATAAYVAPQTAIQKSLAQIWAEVLDVEQVGIDDNFFDLGGHSLLVTQLIARIRTAFQTDLPLRTLFEAPTIAGLANRIEQSQSTEVVVETMLPSRLSIQRTLTQSLPPHLISFQTEGRRPPLFLVHPVAGVVFPYYQLAQLLGAEQPVYGLQSVGIAGEGPPLTQIEAMAKTYLASIRQVQPEGPYQLAGWSFGGLVALELAQQLHRAGQETNLLAIIDRPLTSSALGVSKLFLTTILPHLWPYVSEYLAHQSNQGERPLAWWLGKLKALLRKKERADETPTLNFNPSEIQRLLRVLRANLQAGRQYQPERYSGRVALFKTAISHRSATWGWGDIATSGVELHSIPGHHMNILRSPQVEALAETLGACLAQPAEGKAHH